MSKRKTKRAPKPAAAAPSAPVSLRAYAKLRGVSPEAVSKAISTGRLAKSVTRIGGQPKIADVALANAEWESSTQQRVDQPAPRDTPEYLLHRTAREGASARREAALAEIAELELAERKGEFIRIDVARRDVMEKFTLVRTRLLGLPSRLAQRFPELAGGEVLGTLDSLLVEALEELADGDPDDPTAELEHDQGDGQGDKAA